MKTSRLIGPAIAAILLAGAAGCSAPTSGSAAGGEAGHGAAQGQPLIGPAAPTAADNGKAAAGGASSGSKDAEHTALTPADIQRSIIYNGSVVIRVKDVDAAATLASNLAAGAGGYVGGDDRDIDASRSIATLTLRVPSAQFYTTITALDGLGSPQSRQVSTQDVTGQVIDVQSRLKTEQASVDRIRALMAGTTSISQIVSLEDELTQRESDLESMEAQLRSLTDLTSLSTITATLLGPEARVTVKVEKKKSGFVAGLKSGWNGFVKSLTVLLTALGAVLPFAVAIGIPVLLILWYTRRRRRLARPVAPATEGPSAI